MSQEEITALEEDQDEAQNKNRAQRRAAESNARRKKKRKKRKTFVVRSYTDFAVPDDPDAFIRIKQYAKLHNIHPSTVHRWINEGKLPPPERRGPKVVGWTRRTLAEHHAQQAK
jgi:predicted DNA-binding transcriptional regulator AlpA